MAVPRETFERTELNKCLLLAAGTSSAEVYSNIRERQTSRTMKQARVVGTRAAAVFIVSDLLKVDDWTGFVKGRRPRDFAALASVAEAFRPLQLGKRYNRGRTE